MSKPSFWRRFRAELIGPPLPGPASQPRKTPHNPGPVNEAAFDRIRDFVIAAANSSREPTPEWRAALNDVALDLDKIAYSRLAHPDSVAAAATAMSSLSGVWLNDDEKDQLYLGTLDG